MTSSKFVGCSAQGGQQWIDEPARRPLPEISDAINACLLPQRGARQKGACAQAGERLPALHSATLRGCTAAESSRTMYRNCDAFDGSTMRSRTIPPLRVSAKLRRQAESVLREGETLSGFMLEALTRNVEVRRAQEAFIERGLAGAARARSSGRYVSAGRVIGKLRRRLARARRRAKR